MTPLISLDDNVFAKLEHTQIGGSHKARAASAAVDSLKIPTKLAPEKVVILEKTGGNFGLGLAVNVLPQRYNLNLLVRPSFSAYRKSLLKYFGANLFAAKYFEDKTLSNDAILDIHEKELMAKEYSVYRTNQFENTACLDAHKIACSDELIPQLSEAGVTRDQPVHFVTACGSAAHMSAYGAVLAEHFRDFKLTLVEPTGYDVFNGVFGRAHQIDGISIGIKPPMIKECMPPSAHIEQSPDVIENAVHDFFLRTGEFIGKSSAFIWNAARKISEDKSCKVIFLTYDSGIPYLADQLISKSA